ncbi:hypothetical protein CCHL11_04070, partial [Colletotrichum chlorophyti]
TPGRLITSGNHGSVNGPPVSPRPPPNILLRPRLPAPESRYLEDVVLSNPFNDNADDDNRVVLSRPRENAQITVNGYIKFSTKRAREPVLLPRQARDDSDPQTLVVRLFSTPNFNWEKELQDDDRNLFVFCDVLDKSNCWIENVPRMAATESGVRHAILALSATYVLDYQPKKSIRRAALEHYKKAVIILDLALREARVNTPSEAEADALVSVITLLNMIDVVSPEQRRPRHLLPRWLEGARLACRVLDATDPGHRYWLPENIQPTSTQLGNMIIASRAAILALPMKPLDVEDTNNGKFSWLLQGTARDAHTIHGGCGMSPLLLNRFSQITQVSASYRDDPYNTEFWVNRWAENMVPELEALHQWLPPGSLTESPSADPQADVPGDTPTLSALLRSRDLNKEDFQKAREYMSTLTAEVWRLAAIIYLQCRLMRLPRSHPDVVTNLSKLAGHIRRMPTSGHLFTAQAPFFPVFLLGIVAVEKEHSQCAMDWFHAVIRTSCRSSVPPAFEALERIRAWMATDLGETSCGALSQRIADRQAWWETLVDHIVATEGVLCLI